MHQQRPPVYLPAEIPPKAGSPAHDLVVRSPYLPAAAPPPGRTGSGGRFLGWLVFVLVFLALGVLAVRQNWLSQVLPLLEPLPAPWWVGTWTAPAAKPLSLQLRSQGSSVAGELTFPLTPGYLARVPVLGRETSAAGALLFGVPSAQASQGPEHYFLLVPAAAGQADLYRLRNLGQAQQLAASGQAATLIPTDPAQAHDFVARLVRSGVADVRLEPPASAIPPPGSRSPTPEEEKGGPAWLPPEVRQRTEAVPPHRLVLVADLRHRTRPVGCAVIGHRSAL